jgi:hypothetical protein
MGQRGHRHYENETNETGEQPGEATGGAHEHGQENTE